jgi:methyl coenzyme M reductase subunit C-like uncharacterized protein (methanogenesis marker protein 7)
MPEPYLIALAAPPLAGAAVAVVALVRARREDVPTVVRELTRALRRERARDEVR